MTPMRVAIMGVAALAGLTCCNLVSAAEYQPTSFLQDFAESVQFPQRSGNIIVSVPCRATVSQTGRLQDNHCFVASNTALPFAEAVMAAAVTAILKPAVVDGQLRPAVVHYAVRFERFAAVSLVHVALNHGGHAAIYGKDYVDPQILEPLDVDHLPGTDCARAPDVLWISAMVTADGRVLQPKVNAGRISSACRRSLLREMVEWRFIPAFSEGRPVDAFFSHALLRNPAAITRVDASKVSIE